MPRCSATVPIITQHCFVQKQHQQGCFTLLADAVTVYARTLLQMPQWFLQFCEATGPQLDHLGSGMSSATGEQLLLAFLDRWLDKFDSIGTPAARKLSALALCNVLTLPVTPILDRLDPIAAHLTSVWFEVRPFDTRVTHTMQLCLLPALLRVQSRPSIF